MKTRLATIHQPTRGSSRLPSFGSALVADAMRHGVISATAETPLRSVAQMMAAYHVHCVVLETGDREPSWGVVSDLDLMRMAGEDISERTAREAAATEAPTIRSSETLERAAQLMTEHEVSHLLVMEPGSARPSGVISTLDVAGVLARDEG